MQDHECICALHRACRHVQCARNSARKHRWCMHAVHCVMMWMCVRLCATALQLSTLVFMRDAHACYFVCLRSEGARGESKFAKCVWHVACMLLFKSYIVAEWVQPLNRLQKHSNTVCTEGRRKLCVNTFANWSQKRCLTCQVHVVRMPHENQSVDKVVDQMQTKCRRSVYHAVKTKPTTKPPTGPDVACVYRSSNMFLTSQVQVMKPNHKIPLKAQEKSTNPSHNMHLNVMLVKQMLTMMRMLMTINVIVLNGGDGQPLPWESNV